MGAVDTTQTGSQSRESTRDNNARDAQYAKKDSKTSRLEQRARLREDRETINRMQHERFRKRERNKRIFNYTIVVLIVLAIAYGLYIRFMPSAGGHDALAQCLTQKGVVMYGTEWCTHCQDQKQLFGTSFKYIDFVNCDLHADICEQAGVKGFPTWTFAQGAPVSGTQSLTSLAERTGCVDK